ncbi:hypothetical protein [uncultured Mediterranean phage]|nr:hypothetical protein [uncultured Mediterranean phage]
MDSSIGIGPPVSQGLCPRCEGSLRNGYFEPSCLTCGFADYSYNLGVSDDENVFTSGTMYVLRYAGVTPALKDVLVQVKTVRAGPGAVALVVWCPWCEAEMAQTSLSGKRREKNETRFVCDFQHRVSVLSLGDGRMRWR